MTRFTSKRERRFWAWTLVVVAAIYSTLGLTATLAEALLEAGIFTNAFITAFCLMTIISNSALTWARSWW